MWLVITLPMRIIFRRSVRIIIIMIVIIVIKIIVIVILIELSSNNKLTQHTEQYFQFLLTSCFQSCHTIIYGYPELILLTYM